MSFVSTLLPSAHKRPKSTCDQEVLLHENLLKETLWNITKNELDEIVYLSDREFQNCIIEKITLTNQLFDFYRETHVPLSILKKEYKEFYTLSKYIERWISINNQLDVFTLLKRYILLDLIEVSQNLCRLLE